MSHDGLVAAVVDPRQIPRNPVDPQKAAAISPIRRGDPIEAARPARTVQPKPLTFRHEASVEPFPRGRVKSSGSSPAVCRRHRDRFQRQLHAATVARRGGRWVCSSRRVVGGSFGRASAPASAGIGTARSRAFPGVQTVDGPCGSGRRCCGRAGAMKCPYGHKPIVPPPPPAAAFGPDQQHGGDAGHDQQSDREGRGRVACKVSVAAMDR